MTIGLPPGHRVYAVGDIHGMHDSLLRMLDLIDLHLAAYPPSGPVTEIFLGDYVDRGPDSFGVIETLLAPRDNRQRICLLGNHEDAMMGALNDAHLVHRWLTFGGEATCLSYGLDVDVAGRDPQALQPWLNSALPTAHRDFLFSLPRQVEIGGVLFVHAGIRPGVPLGEQDPHDLIWIREEFLDYGGPLPMHVVHGHTPVSEPEHHPFRTNIDTGAVFGGALTAAVMEGEEVSFLTIPTR